MFEESRKLYGHVRMCKLMTMIKATNIQHINYWFSNRYFKHLTLYRTKLHVVY